jgi:hypothetical protein
MTKLRGVVDILQGQTTPPPGLLYKYGAFDKWTHTIFLNNELYFQSPDRFNDPFDSDITFQLEGSKQQRKRLFRKIQPRVDPNIPRRRALFFEKRFKGQHWDAKSKQVLKRRFLEIRAGIGVYCMTEVRDSIVMWSHYASLHTGFCLEFRTDDPFFSQVHPVEYAKTNELPCVNVLLNWDKATSAHAEGLLTKAKEWAYEREWRIIDPMNSVGVRRFPPRVLHGVILGCRASADDTHQMIEWCKAREPRPVLYRAHTKETEFGLEINSVNY